MPLSQNGKSIRARPLHRFDPVGANLGRPTTIRGTPNPNINGMGGHANAYTGTHGMSPNTIKPEFL